MANIPLAVNLSIEDFSDTSITKFSSFLKNFVVEVQGPDPNNQVFIRQRPGFVINTTNDTAKTKGRGIFFWDSTSTLYFVNDDTIYKDAYTSVASLDSGYNRIYATEVSDKFFITDPQNNKGYVFNTGEVLTAIVDPDFPSSIVGGAVNLNGRAYVLDPDGNIYGSALDVASSWDALNVIQAERVNDTGIFLALHHDHIVYFGSKSIEFFRDAANPTGSVLQRRNDVFYNVGAISEDSIWQAGDTIYFLGTESKGSLSLYKLDRFSLTKIPNYGLSSYFSNLIYRKGKGVLLSGFQAQDDTYLLMTAYDLEQSDYAQNYYTFAYEESSNLIYWFSSDVSGIGDTDALEIVDWTIRTGSSVSLGRGITSSGDIVSVRSVLSAQDSSLEDYVEDDYVEDDYVVSGTTSDIPTIVRTGFDNGNTSTYKFGRFLEILGDYTTNAANITVKWSDTDALDSSYSGSRTLDMNRKQRLDRLGRFVQRSHQLEYTGPEPLRIKAIDLKLHVGGK